MMSQSETPKVYVASCLENWSRVQVIIEELNKRGVEITYDWTKWGKQICEGAAVPETQKSDEESDEGLKKIAESELLGVDNADVVLAVMPGARGTHFEMCAAWSSSIPIILLLDEDTASHKTSFHYLDNIERFHDLPAAIERTIKLAQAIVMLKPYGFLSYGRLGDHMVS